MRKIALVFFSVLLSAGVNAQAPTPAAPATPAAAPVAPAVPADAGVKFVTTESFVYDPTGRRDPFKSFISGFDSKKDSMIVAGPNSNLKNDTSAGIPSYLQAGTGSDSLENYDVGQLRVVAILWDVQDPKAMMSSPTRKMFMVHRRSKIGKNNGYVANIREGEVVVVEEAADGRTPTTRVMVLRR